MDKCSLFNVKQALIGLLTLLLTACNETYVQSDQPSNPPIDTVAPFIVLNGKPTIFIAEGSRYDEAGATAADDVYGRIPVTITGEVDSHTPATYTLTYTATDAAGNRASITRTVVVSGIRAFITTWKTDNEGISEDNQIRIGTFGDGYHYSIDWGDGQFNTGVAGDITHSYDSPGTYRVAIKGDFPQIYFSRIGYDSDAQTFSVFSHDNHKLLAIEQWGDIQWRSMESAFREAQNMVSNALDAPDLSQVTSMEAMFNGATAFNSDISQWDVSSVTNMRLMFNEATAFNGDISQWDVSNVASMADMFGNGSGLSVANYDALFNNWSFLILQNDVVFNAGNSQYSASSQAARDFFSTQFNWTITDAGVAE